MRSSGGRKWTADLSSHMNCGVLPSDTQEDKNPEKKGIEKGESKMIEDRESIQKTGVRKFLMEVEPIRLKEPLAATLGLFAEEGAILDYTFVDVVKMAGHACPTTAGAYLCCKKALEALYPDEVPVRGNVAIKIYGEQDEGVYGVIGQVFSLLTGAAPASGFRGLMHKFGRKDLLEFSEEKIDHEASCFEFKRLDNDDAVVVKLYPRRIPFAEEKAKRTGELIQKVIWEAAKDDEKKEFEDLWMEKIENMVLREDRIDEWIKIEKKGN